MPPGSCLAGGAGFLAGGVSLKSFDAMVSLSPRRSRMFSGRCVEQVLAPRLCPPRFLPSLSFCCSGLWFPLPFRGFPAVTITLLLMLRWSQAGPGAAASSCFCVSF